MAISKKPLSLPLVPFFTTIFLMLLSKVNSFDSLSFNISEFKKDDHNLIYQGDADVTSGDVLQLTPATINSVGRLLHKEEVHLWSNSTNDLTSFETSINFKLTSPTPKNPGDGFTFFIAPSDSTIPPDSNGQYLGIIDPKNKTNNIVVAVEVDTYSDAPIDPNRTHIGIDLHSIKSVITTEWDRAEGPLGNIRINYNSDTHNLSVISTYPRKLGSKKSAVSYIVNLRKELPEWVRVGLSASTGDQTEVHEIHSWSFGYTLQYPPLKKEDMLIASVV